VAEPLEYDLLSILNHVRWKYGMEIHEELEAKRLFVSIGAVYTTLDRLEAEGLVESKFARDLDDDEARGGRAKRWFRLTSNGIRRRHELEQAKPHGLPHGAPATNRSRRTRTLAPFLITKFINRKNFCIQ
jgi:PadR family transcriptional regulator, regulatory protein PadR